VLVMAVALSACGGSRHLPAALVGDPTTSTAPRTVPPPTTTSSSTTTSTTTPPGPTAPASTVTATVNGPAPASSSPGTATVGRVPSTWYGYTSILPVIAPATGWVEVREAQRPNGSTAWVPARDVTLSSTPYYLILSLATEHLEVFENRQLRDDFPAGIGTPDDPTVTGQFFITMKAPPPNAGYGPLVLVTSAHSNTITDWEESGDAIIAIHGPIDALDDRLIGTTGAAISHGCIRLHDRDLAQLSTIPPGTPLDIVG
jgi:lipoprotein-anchoring transpeptidase ErfK/SrfK